jgi:HEAT repeat protein
MPSMSNRPGTRSSKKTTVNGKAWRIWWDLNRANLVDIRGLERRAVITGPGTREVERDPLGTLRPEVRETLRALASRRTEATEIRTAALHALGRAGDADDVGTILAILRNKAEDETVRESAALALALLPPLRSQEAREQVRHALEWCIVSPAVPQGLRGFALIAAGFRARDDEALGLLLAARCKGDPGSWDEGAALALALGLSENTLLLPELMDAAVNSRLCGAQLSDVARSHAILALGRTKSPEALEALGRILGARRTGIESRRSAALAMGSLLRDGGIDAGDARPAARELAKALETGRDPLVRGYSAVALGAARPPQELTLLQESARRGDPVVRAFAALGVGLAAREIGGAESRMLRALLSDELPKVKDAELACSFIVASGLAGAQEAVPDILARLEDPRSTEAVRTAAAEALGMIAAPSAQVTEALRAALLAPEVHLARAAAESLGMLGDRNSAVRVLALLDETKSSHLHSHMAAAIGLAGSPTATAPMLALLRNEGSTTLARADAAMALGLLGDPRDADTLFRFGAWFNVDATTVATHEILGAACGCRARGAR